MTGECLCGEVKFEIDGKLPNLYQCHCSLCRKTTGSTANAATFVSEIDFRWVSEQASIRSFQRPTGYRNDFCSLCGSSVPNKLRNTAMMWVPAGLLNEETSARVAVHLHFESAPEWDQEAPYCQWLDKAPKSLEALNAALL
ncbi:GFA family protein [Halomonas sp. HMF6819]